MVQTHFGWHQLALRCVATELLHPITQEPLHLRAGLTAPWAALCEAWGWQTQGAHIEDLPPSYLHDCLHSLMSERATLGEPDTV